MHTSIIPLGISRREEEQEIAGEDDGQQSGHLLPVEAHQPHSDAGGDRESIAEVQGCVAGVEQVPKDQSQGIAGKHQQNISDLNKRDNHSPK